MNPHARFRLTILLLFVLLVVGIFLGATISAQQANLGEAIKAVVRIRGCNSAGCKADLGSGVIIDSSGVILTANHVTLTDLNNLLSPHLEDFVIEVTENARLVPQVRYRARLIASKPDSDLALLGIYWDEATNQRLDDPSAVHLPALALADVNTITLGEQLHILGYPLAGGLTVNYTAAALGGFDENGALLKVQVPLSEGNSGGPALVERNGQYEIAGLVIRGRGSRNEVGLIRSIDQLHSLIWEPTARRVWLDNVQVSTQGSGADATVKISADIHALDYTNHDGRLLAYVFDANTQQSWPAGAGSLDRSANGQLVLRQTFTATQMVDVLLQQILTLPLKQLNVQADRLVFKLLLWDVERARALWRDSQWRSPQAVSTQVTLTPIQSSMPTLAPTGTVTPTFTPIQPPTFTATPTPLPMPTSTPTFTPTTRLILMNTATNTSVSLTVVPTPTPSPIPTGDVVTLRGPLDNVLKGQLTFSWESSIQLADDEYYEMVFWLDGKEPMENAFSPVGASKATSVTVDLDKAVNAENLRTFLIPGQIYRWGVLLAKLNPYKRLRYLGGEHRFRFELTPGSPSVTLSGSKTPKPPSPPTPKK